MNVGAAPTFTYRVTVNQTLGDGVLRNAVVGGNCPAGTTAARCAVQHAPGTYTGDEDLNRPAGSTVLPFRRSTTRSR